MKLYRVTVRRRSDGTIFKQKVFTSRGSMHSFKGYWGSRGNWNSSWEKMYEVTVETAFVTSWAAIDPNLEKIEAAISNMSALSEDDLSALIERLGANLAAKVA